jgi:O-Antigen ligase
MGQQSSIKVVLLSIVTASCLCEFVLHHQSSIFRGFEAAMLQTKWGLLVWLALWCGIFLFLTICPNDLPLIGLLLIALVAYFFDNSLGAIVLLFGVTLGRATPVLLNKEAQDVLALPVSTLVTRHSPLLTFLFGLIMLLAFASWWHLDMTNNFYHGPRWMGLWDNPNTYGMLMASGVALATGLLAARIAKDGKWEVGKLFLWLVMFMMSIGLMMSYSRGAWMAMAIGLLYLTWCYGKLKWRYVLPGIVLVVVAVLFFWSRTPDSAPWYVKRADLGRPSAQHRISAWRAGLEIMRDHPFGVGWNEAVGVYQKNYSPPENGAGAIATNDYLMLGTQLGIPALLCFVGYAALCLRGKLKIETEEGRILAACRAGAIVFLVTFWFDGGLFKLPTAALFWILLELGKSNFVAAPRPQTVTLSTQK